jgi:MSHA biogenesis protein MshN
MNADSSLRLTPPQVILPALPLPTSDVGQVVVAQSEVKPKQVVALNTPTVPVNPQSITEVANSDKRISVTKRMSAEQQANHEYQQAVNYLQQGRVAESLDLLKRALHTSPTHDDARLTLIGLLVENQHHEEAMEVLRIGLNLAPYHTAYAQTLARLQLEVSQPQQALETLKKYDAYAERDATYQSLMAVVLQKLQMHTEAITRFESAIKLGETSAARFVGLAVSLQAEGRSQEAAAAYQRALGGNLSPELALFVDQRLKQLRN